jgi:hypothetical protein
MRRIDRNFSRLERFLQRHGVAPGDLQSASGYSLKHLVNVRKGTAKPTFESATAIRLACEKLLGRGVSFDELFDVEPRRKSA